MTRYIAIVHKDPDSDYGVSFPDFPGCISVGSTVEEAREMAAEALALHIEGMEEDGEEIPFPSVLESIRADPDNAGALAFIVVPAPKTETVRVNVSFRASALSRIDAAAKRRKLSRSAFLAEAALAHAEG